MNTSAPPDLVANFDGVLISHAQARIKPVDAQGHMVPVLCMDIELDDYWRHHLHVEQPFAPDAHQACEAAAHRYRKGTRVTVHAPVVGLQLWATNTTHIHVHHPEETTT